MLVSWLLSVLVGHVCHGADTRLCVVSNQGLIVETKRALATATAAAAKVGLEGTVVTPPTSPDKHAVKQHDARGSANVGACHLATAYRSPLVPPGLPQPPERGAAGERRQGLAVTRTQAQQSQAQRLRDIASKANAAAASRGGASGGPAPLATIAGSPPTWLTVSAPSLPASDTAARTVDRSGLKGLGGAEFSLPSSLNYGGLRVPSHASHGSSRGSEAAETMRRMKMAQARASRSRLRAS